MARTRTQTLRVPIIRWASVAAVILMVLFCGLLSSSPKLHAIIHPDANDQHHQCAITMVADGHVDLTDGGQNLAPPIVFESRASVYFESAILSSSDYLLLPGRAPPVLAS